MDRVTVDPEGAYLVADGERWFPSGWCCAKPEVLTADDLRRMAEAGCNTVRLWPDHNETGVLREDLPDLVRDAGALGTPPWRTCAPAAPGGRCWCLPRSAMRRR